VKGRAIDEEDRRHSGKLGQARSVSAMTGLPHFHRRDAGKTALLYWRKRWLVPHGTTATTHILKPQIGKLESGVDLSGSVENEHLCLKP
jgi:hypothetical protein